jgi:hypothetical protein
VTSPKAGGAERQCRAPLPPYGRSLAEARLRGQAPNCWVCAGADGWQRAQWRLLNVGPGSALVLPSGTDPDSYSWPVRRLDLLLLWPDGSPSEVEGFARTLIRAGAALVSAIGRDETIFAHPT